MLPAHASSPYSPHTSQHLPTSPYTALHLQAHASLEEDEELDEEALLDFAPQLGAPATLALALALTLTLTLTLALTPHTCAGGATRTRARSTSRRRSDAAPRAPGFALGLGLG